MCGKSERDEISDLENGFVKDKWETQTEFNMIRDGADWVAGD